MMMMGALGWGGSEAQAWTWTGDPLSIPFRLRASTTKGRFKSQATCVASISLRDLDLQPILVMPQRMHVDVSPVAADPVQN